MTLACGTLPGALSNKYMLVDGDKVVFGSYFAWRASRIDRNMITVMTGQVVEAFDRDFRELYAVSDTLDLYEELHVARPSARVSPPRPRASSKRPLLPATTSRFQVSLGDAHNAPLQVPAHKYHNPKYLLAMGGVVQPARSLHDFLATSEAAHNLELELEPGGRPRVTSSERLDRPSPMPSEEPPEDTAEMLAEAAPRRRSLFRSIFKSSRKKSVRSAAGGHDEH
ncbi:hypothetical protein CRUP_005834 [Coryphaenoides rupestris]|nr:hypothetical protein CRUP_005834 [Coryphaenoides rupestris]